MDMRDAWRVDPDILIVRLRENGRIDTFVAAAAAPATRDVFYIFESLADAGRCMARSLENTRLSCCNWRAIQDCTDGTEFCDESVQFLDANGRSIVPCANEDVVNTESSIPEIVKCTVSAVRALNSDCSAFTQNSTRVRLLL